MGEGTPRAILFGMLRLERGLDPEAMAQLASGGRFAPPPLTDAERERQNGKQREHRSFANRPQAIAKIASEIAEEIP